MRLPSLADAMLERLIRLAEADYRRRKTHLAWAALQILVRQRSPEMQERTKR